MGKQLFNEAAVKLQPPQFLFRCCRTKLYSWKQLRLYQMKLFCFCRKHKSWRAAMSLYDDLGVGASDTKTEGWSKNFKLLQSQLKVKKAALTQAKVGTCNTSTIHTCDTLWKINRSSQEIYWIIVTGENRLTLSDRKACNHAYEMKKSDFTE